MDYIFVHQEWDILQKTTSEDTYERITPINISNNSFATQMQEARIKKRLTIDALSSRLGIHTNLISSYENGSEIPPQQIRDKLKEILEI